MTYHASVPGLTALIHSFPYDERFNDVEALKRSSPDVLVKQFHVKEPNIAIRSRYYNLRSNVSFLPARFKQRSSRVGSMNVTLMYFTKGLYVSILCKFHDCRIDL